MESPVYVIGYRLGVPTLDGVKEVGFRFVFHKRIGILSTIFLRLDMEEELRTPFVKALKDRDIPCDMKDRVIYGKINKDGIFFTKDEENAHEVSSLAGALHWADDMEDYSKNFKEKLEKFNKNFYNWVETLKHFLRVKDVEVFRDEINVSQDSLCCSIRFLGGYENWRGGHGDICDADEMSSSLYYKLREVVKLFNEKYEDECVLNFQTGEKAYTYFYFKPEID